MVTNKKKTLDELPPLPKIPPPMPFAPVVDRTVEKTPEPVSSEPLRGLGVLLVIIALIMAVSGVLR